MIWEHVSERDLEKTADSLRDSIHIWWCPNIMDANTDQASTGWLDGSETNRAAGFRFEDDRTRFLKRRIFQRKLLSAYVGLNPSDIVYTEDATAKPEITNSADPDGLEFNSAHAADSFLIAVRRSGAVGIDLEHVVEQPALDLVAQDNFRLAERAVLDTAAPADWLTRFYQIWTQKEAALKAVGKGLSVSPHDIEVRLDTGPVHWSGALAATAGTWNSALFHPSPGTVAALVVEGPVPELRFLQPA